MNRKTVTVLATLALVGCGGSKPGETRTDAAFPPGGPTLSIQQESLWPGSTNAGVLPLLRLRAQSLREQKAASLLEALQTNISFTPVNGGDTTAAVVTAECTSCPTPSPGKEPPPISTLDFADYLFVAQPVSGLLPDTWYDVRCQELPETTIFADDSYSLASGLVTRVYTGSAPQLRKLDVIRESDASTKTGNYLIVYLSEPVPVEDLIGGGVAISASTPGIEGCIVWGSSACLETPPPQLSEMGLFRYQLQVSVPLEFELLLSLSLRGQARTVQGALDAGAVLGTTTVADGFLRYPMDISSWRQRSGGSFGWSSVE